MIGVVRYDGLLDLSLSRDYRRLTHPTFYLDSDFDVYRRYRKEPFERIYL